MTNLIYIHTYILYIYYSCIYIYVKWDQFNRHPNDTPMTPQEPGLGVEVQTPPESDGGTSSTDIQLYIGKDT